MMDKKKGRKRFFRRLAAIGCLFLCLDATAQMRSGGPVPQAPSPAAPKAKPMILKMQVNEAGVTAHISNCPMQTALQELAERTGIVFEVRTQDNPYVSLHLNGVQLEEAIQRIASGSNTLFFYSESSFSSQHISLVKIVPPKTSLPQPSIAYLGTGAITKSNDNIMTSEQAFKALEKNEKIEMRKEAVEYLVSTKNPDAAEAIMKCLSDPAPEIRVAAIDGLAALGAREAISAIVRRLKDSSPGVRQSAAAAVALLGDSTNIKDLKPLASDRDGNVAAAAEIAIRKLSASAKR